MRSGIANGCESTHWGVFRNMGNSMQLAEPRIRGAPECMLLGKCERVRDPVPSTRQCGADVIEGSLALQDDKK